MTFTKKKQLPNQSYKTNVVQIYRRKRAGLGKRGNVFRRWDEAGSSLLALACQSLNQRRQRLTRSTGFAKADITQE